jgi:hypothetical protein
MEHKIVGTEEFWRLMCTWEFLRLDLHRGAVRNVVIVTKVAPEEVDGFMEARLAETIERLRTEPALETFRALCRRIASRRTTARASGRAPAE